MAHFIGLFCFAFILVTGVLADESLVVSLSSDGPAERGSTFTFSPAEAGYEGKTIAYAFRDNGKLYHRNTSEQPANVSDWTVEYKKSLYEAGEYIVTVQLEKYFIIDCVPVFKAQTNFNVTAYRAVKNEITLNAARNNSNNIPIDTNITLSHCRDKLRVRESKSSVNITDTNWLQHEELINLQVKYSGSPPFNYCIQYKLGQYNITGNETCTAKSTTTLNVFPVVHYFSDKDQHMVVVLIENNLDKIVNKVTIRFYKAPVTTQLSIIVVPVFFCLVAVILVVFGIAYHQHRTRRILDDAVVADINFSQGHPVYMTFVERLRYSFRNAFNIEHNEETEPLLPNHRRNG